MSDELPWTHAVTEIPDQGLSGKRVATARERAAIVSALDLVSCRSLEASYRISPQGGGRYRLTGQLSGEVEQACIVTLEPVGARIEDSFDVEFWPEGEPEPQQEGEMDALSAAEIEPIAGGRIDVGRIVFESLAAGVDPFLRKEGAALEQTEAGGEGAPSPFAALAKLRAKN